MVCELEEPSILNYGPADPVWCGKGRDDEELTMVHKVKLKLKMNLTFLVHSLCSDVTGLEVKPKSWYVGHQRWGSSQGVWYMLADVWPRKVNTSRPNPFFFRNCPTGMWMNWKWGRIGGAFFFCFFYNWGILFLESPALHIVHVFLLLSSFLTLICRMEISPLSKIGKQRYCCLANQWKRRNVWRFPRSKPFWPILKFDSLFGLH